MNTLLQGDVELKRAGGLRWAWRSRSVRITDVTHFMQSKLDWFCITLILSSSDTSASARLAICMYTHTHMRGRKQQTQRQQGQCLIGLFHMNWSECAIKNTDMYLGEKGQGTRETLVTHLLELKHNISFTHEAVGASTRSHVS